MNTFESSIERQSGISESLARLITEAVFLQADQIYLSLENSALAASILQSSQELKRSELSAESFPQIVDWLEARSLTGYDTDAHILPGSGPEGSEYSACMRLKEEIVTFRVKRSSSVGREGRRSIRLSEFLPLSLERARGALFLQGEQRRQYESITSVSSGLMLLCSPDSENLKRVISYTLSTSAFIHLGELEQEFAGDEVLKLSARYPVLLSTRSDDVVDALLRLNRRIPGIVNAGLAGIVCQGLVRGVCRDCARESIPDRFLIKSLPPALQPPAELSYLVGRGCELCRSTGYRGLTGVQQVLVPGKDLAALLEKGASQPQLIDLLCQRGLSSLLQDGTRKVTRGLLTYESLFSLSKTVPQGWLKHLERAESAPVEEPELLPEGIDFFGPEQGQINLRPVSGREAFTPGVKQEALHQKAKRRERPLLLIVEDDIDQSSILQMVLKGESYDVFTASDGEEALELLGREIPDLIITDLMMPRLDGAEFVRRLKSDIRFRSIPVMVLTVVSDADRECSLLDLGADDYCEKTVQKKVLLRRIASLLRRRVA